MKRQRLNGADAAERLGVSASTVTRWLKGTGAPDLKRVDELAEVMDVPSTDLVVAIFDAKRESDPLLRIEALLEAVLARMDGIEARQADLEARLVAVEQA